MVKVQSKLTKDRKEIIEKFNELIEKAKTSCQEYKDRGDGTLSGDVYFQLRVSSLNLLSRLSSEDSFYVRELINMKQPNAFVIKGILEAALTDYQQGFMVDNKLLISAEIFADFLVQAEILLEHEYKDAAAVIIRAVLEDGLRKLCEANGIQANKREGIHQLNEKLYKAKVFTKLQYKEVDAKKQIGNDAAHARFNTYSKEDVVAFYEFVRRLLSSFLR